MVVHWNLFKQSIYDSCSIFITGQWGNDDYKDVENGDDGMNDAGVEPVDSVEDLPINNNKEADDKQSNLKNGGKKKNIHSTAKNVVLLRKKEIDCTATTTAAAKIIPPAPQRNATDMI